MKNKITKKLLLGLPVAFMTASLTSCGSFDVPTFEKSSGIKFCAYAGPTVSSFGNVDSLNEKCYSKVAEAGFNKVLALYEGGCGTADEKIENLKKRAAKAQQDAARALELCAKYNLKYYVRDWNLYGLSNEKEMTYIQGINCYEEYVKAMKYILADDNTYVHHPNYLGSYIFDEPVYSQIKGIGEVVKAYKERMTELGITDGYDAIVNLLPCHGGISNYGPKGYDGYIDEFIDKVGKQVGYISYDFYPLMKSKNGSEYKSLYLYNLQLVADKAKQNGLQPRCYIQSKGDYTGMRDMTCTGDIRVQVYTSLAFGYDDMTYYEYGGKNSDTESEYSLFDLTRGVENWTWNCAKQVNNEVHAFEDAYKAYEYDDVTYKSADSLLENKNFLNLIHHAEEFDKAKIKSVTQDTLLTSFKNKKDQSPAYMLVNFADPYYQKDSEVTIKFKGAKGLLMYRFGQKMIVDLPFNGEYTFKLTPGEGRFIIPLN